MNARLKLERAIAVIDSQRTLLGDSVADVTLTALRAKRELMGEETAVLPEDRVTQRKQLTILFAKVDGFTEATQTLPNTRMLNIINLLWQRLDRAITDQGGMVDKHMGDGVMGLFGVPVAGEDDPQRAVRAALNLRTALADFIAEIHMDLEDEVANMPEATAVLAALDALSLRVGINTGPVLLGEIGTGDEYTVIGDPVNVASRLENRAPKGGILISHESYQLVHDTFEMDSLGLMQIRGKPDPIQVYLVQNERSCVFSDQSWGVEGVETSMVGRDKELLVLQNSLQNIVRQGKGEVITIVGEAGIGKSRLKYEFEKWMDTLDLDVLVLKGRTEPSMRQVPYSLIRNLFMTYFAIQDNDPAPVVKEKLFQQMWRHFPDDAPERVSCRGRSLAQLLGLDLEEGFSLWEQPKTREATLGDIILLLRKALAGNQAGVVILEDVHWADEGSLDLIENFVELCRDVPLLILCISRPELLERRAHWARATAVNSDPRLLKEGVPQRVVHLEMLTVEESSQLVENILRKLPDIPPALSDLIIHRSAGNPFYVEELVKVLIEDGVIVTEGDAWRVLKKQLTDVRIPATLTGVLQSRLDRLSSLERVTLQRSAVIGRVFWDTPVILMNHAASQTAVHAPETVTALKALEKRDLIFQRSASVFAGSNAFLFKHEMLREVAYDSVLLRMRPAYHKQVADWLVQESGERVAEYSGLIAEHYEKAHQKIPAAQMYEMAGNRAIEFSNPELSLSHFQKVLELIADEPHQNGWRITIMQQVAALLRMQARLVETAVAYDNMRQLAEADGELSAQAIALTSLSGVLLDQMQYEQALAAADKAEKIAWLVGDDLLLANALLNKSWANHRLGHPRRAQQQAQQALTLSEQLKDNTLQVNSLRNLIMLAIDLGKQAHVAFYLNRLQDLINHLDQEKVELMTIGLGFITLGEINNRLGRYGKVARPSFLAIRIFKKLDRQELAAQALFNLGRSGCLRGDYEQAIPFYREAMAIAITLGDRFQEMFYRMELGAAFVGLKQYEQAEIEIVQVIRLADNNSRFVQWRGIAQAFHYATLALLGQGRLIEALAAAKRTYSKAILLRDERMLGVAWYGLGLVSAQLAPKDLPITIRDKSCMPGDCFAESIRYLRRANGDSTGAFREQALTMAAWAAYEMKQQKSRRSQILASEAKALAEEIGLTL